jgi:hypothetical protein
MSEQVDQKQRVLKAVVIGLGIAIVVCVGIIVVGLAMRASRLDTAQPPQTPADAPPAAAPAAARTLGTVDVPLPAGARVVSVAAAGGELHVLLDLPEGRRLLLVDRATGGVLGTLRFVPAAAP